MPTELKAKNRNEKKQSYNGAQLMGGGRRGFGGEGGFKAIFSIQFDRNTGSHVILGANKFRREIFGGKFWRDWFFFFFFFREKEKISFVILVFFFFFFFISAKRKFGSKVEKINLILKSFKNLLDNKHKFDVVVLQSTFLFYQSYSHEPCRYKLALQFTRVFLQCCKW